jgi:hypothetical protein
MDSDPVKAVTCVRPGVCPARLAAALVLGVT